MHTFSKLFKLMLLAGLLSWGNAQADIRQLYYAATPGQPSWKIENYPGNVVAVWNTSSSCSQGALGFATDVTVADKNRFYATVMAVKASNLTMFVYYNALPDSRNIVSFGLM